MSARIKPHALRPGDLVGVVSPAAAVDGAHLTRGVAALQALGYRVKVSDRALLKERVVAGSDEVRADDLRRFFEDPEVRAIFVARGGYGSGRLLPHLDFARLARTPKILMGYSDLTFVLNALVQAGGLICFHGPTVAKNVGQTFGAQGAPHLRALLAGELKGFTLEGRDALAPGVAQGELIGGCLSILVAMLGTPYAPDFTGKILLLEDTGERAYRIDRMLEQLRQSGALAKVAGIVFGGMRSPGGNELEQGLIYDFAAHQTAGLGVPVLWGLEVGHATENFAVPLGMRVRLDARARQLHFAEAAVEQD